MAVHLKAVCLAVAVAMTAADRGDIIAQSDFRFGVASWTVTGTNAPVTTPELDGDRIFATETESTATSKWYFSSPKTFTAGSSSILYNGFVTFELGHFEVQSFGANPTSDFDVILVSSKASLSVGLKGVFRNDGALYHNYAVRIDEDFSPEGSTTKWQIHKTGRHASQSDLARCLDTLISVSVRGGYFAGSESTWLRNVALVEGLHSDGMPIDGKLEDDVEVIDGVTVPKRRTAPAPSSLATSHQQTCTSAQRVTLSFDRPGCGEHRQQTCSASDFTDNTVHEMNTWDSIQSGLMPVYNQNIGLRATPIKKPFNRQFTFKRVPYICSVATLEVEAHGDLTSIYDSIEVYGEDGAKLGVLFAGNLTDKTGDHRSTHWTEGAPWTDAIAISKSRMTLYSADRQLSLSLRAARGADDGDRFIGTIDLLTTNDCNSPPCDLVGKVLFRRLTLSYAPVPCFVSQLATDTAATVNAADGTVSLPVSFAVPSGLVDPSADGAIVAVAGKTIVDPFNYLTVESTDGDKWGTLFTKQAGDWGEGDSLYHIGTRYGGPAAVELRIASTAQLPKEKLQTAISGKSWLSLRLTSDHTSGVSSAHISPVRVIWPIHHCFQKVVDTGTHFNRHLERPNSLQFAESGFATPSSDLFVTVTVDWQTHARYTNQPGGNNPETPLLRADSQSMPNSLVWEDFPEKVLEHKKWPHGHGYLQLRAGTDAAWLADLFLGDLSQYDASGYLVDSVVVPKDSIVNGNFNFTLWVPPGYGVIQLRSIIVGYAAASTSTVEDTTTSTLNAHHSHGPV